MMSFGQDFVFFPFHTSLPSGMDVSIMLGHAHVQYRQYYAQELKEADMVRLNVDDVRFHYSRGKHWIKLHFSQ
jgi:hypothetical protein